MKTDEDKPMTSIEFLDAVKEKRGIKNDNKLALFLEADQSRISQIRNGKRRLDDSLAKRVAEALGLEPIYVMMCVQAERAPRFEIEIIWRDAAEQIKKSTAAALGVVAFSGLLGTFCLPSPAQAVDLMGDSGKGDRTMYIM